MLPFFSSAMLQHSEGQLRVGERKLELFIVTMALMNVPEVRHSSIAMSRLSRQLSDTQHELRMIAFLHVFFM